MPSEGQHSWYSSAHLPLLSSQGLATISDDYGQLEEGPRRRCRWHLRVWCEPAAGRMEQLADVDRNEPVASRLKDHAATGIGPTRQSDARDLGLLVFSRRGTGRVTIITCWEHHFFLADHEWFGAWFDLLRPLFKFLDNDLS